jgi:hypothetical protein
VNARHTAALLALAVAGCGSAASTVGARFDGPTAIVPFIGATAKEGGQLHDYLAVASSRGDELTFLDPSDDQPVLGPGAVFPLVIPTAPNPLLLAAAPLGDGGADLLVAVSAGGRAIQLVNTWDPAANRVVTPDVDLSAALQGGIVAIAATTVPGASPAQVRVIVGAAGRQLAVVTFTRQPDGGVAPEPFDAATASRSLDFEPVHMAVEPAAAASSAPAPPRLFVATPDPILPPATTLGVAQLTMTGAPTDWPIAALDARAGTTLVAAARVRELDLPKGRTDPKGREIFLPKAVDPALRVYAALDPSTCGVGGRINCGLATLDPDAGGLAPDPASEALLDPIAFPDPATAPPAVPPQSYRAPVLIPGGVITAIAIAFPSSATTTPGPARDETDPLNLGVPQLTTTAAVRVRKTTAVAAVTSSDGRAYLVDLGRFGLLEDALPLGVFPRFVTLAQSVAATGAAADAPQLGLHGDFPPVVAVNVAGVTTDAAALPQLIQATPGFTPTDSWSVTYRGVLPGLTSRRGILFESGGSVFLAAQSPRDTAAPAVVDVAVGAPELGVRPSEGHLAEHDSAFVTCPDGSAAPETLVDAVVAAQRQPSDPVPSAGAVAVPGGALQLAGPVCGLAVAATLSVTFTLRASGFVLASAGLGYAGRPELDKPFSFAWQGEDAAGLAPEDRALAAKARRRYYSAEAACITAAGDPAPQNRGCYGNLPAVLDPLAPGPAVAFELGLSPSALLTALPVDTRISFSTDAGLTPVARRPTTAGLLPQGLTVFDVSKLPGRENDPVRFYTAYSDDQVLVFTTAGSAGDVTSIR